MRLRVLALPTQTLGAATYTPFLLVFDRCSDDVCEYLNAAEAKEATGAAGVFVFTEEIELDEVFEVDGLDLSALKTAFERDPATA